LTLLFAEYIIQVKDNRVFKLIPFLNGELTVCMFKNTFVLLLDSSYSLCLLAVDSQVFIGDLIHLRTTVYDHIPYKAVAK